MPPPTPSNATLTIGKLLNIPESPELSDDEHHEEEEEVPPVFSEILDVNVPSFVSTSKPKSQAKIHAEHQAWKLSSSIRRRQPHLPPLHLTAGMPNPLRPSKTSSPMATVEDLRQARKRIGEELADLEEKKLRLEQEMRTPLSDIINQDLAITTSRPNITPLLLSPPKMSPRILLLSSGQSTFVISTRRMSFSVTFSRHDDMSLDANGILPSTLAITGGLPVDEYNRFVYERLQNVEWKIARLRVESVGVDTYFESFSNCYSNRERVAYFKVSESTRLFLVVPELRDNATGLRGIKMKSSKMYGVLLYKREVNVGA